MAEKVTQGKAGDYVELSVRFDQGTYDDLVALAVKRERTLAAQVRVAVREHLEKEGDAAS